MKGDVTKHGVFSWNCPHLCAAEACQWLTDGEEPFYVMGTVKLWGEVCEHERGYRSEFAEVASLDSITVREDGPTMFSISPMWEYQKHFSFPALRKEYGL